MVDSVRQIGTDNRIKVCHLHPLNKLKTVDLITTSSLQETSITTVECLYRIPTRIVRPILACSTRQATRSPRFKVQQPLKLSKIAPSLVLITIIREVCSSNSSSSSMRNISKGQTPLVRYLGTLAVL